MPGGTDNYTMEAMGAPHRVRWTAIRANKAEMPNKLATSGAEVGNGRVEVCPYYREISVDHPQVKPAAPLERY